MRDDEMVADIQEDRGTPEDLMEDISDEQKNQKALREQKKKQKQKFYEKEIIHRGKLDEFGSIIKSR